MWYYDQTRGMWINRQTGATSRTKPAQTGSTTTTTTPPSPPSATMIPQAPKSSGYPTHTQMPSSPHYPAYGAPQKLAQPGGQYMTAADFLHPWPTGAQVAFPISSNFRSQAEYMQAVKNWQYQSQQAMKSDVWRRSMGMGQTQASRGGGGGTGGAGGTGGKGKPLDPNAGKTLPGLPPELQRWYEEQLSGARTEEERAIAQARTAQRSALMQAAEQRRAAGRAAATGAVDAGAAMASLGLGSSPALMGAALDEVYGTGGAGMLAADAARTAALENFLRAQEEAVGAGRRRKSELQDWRALQIAALANEDLAKLIGMSPGGKK